MKSKYVVLLSIVMSLVLVASVIGCGSKTSTSSTTTKPPTTTTTNPPTSSTTNPPTSSTTNPPTSSATTGTTTTTKPPTSSTTKPPTTTKPPSTSLLPGQTILKTASSTVPQPMLHLIVGFEKCVNCHWPGKPGAMDPANGVLHLVTTGHHCDECHPSGYGLTPYFDDWDKAFMQGEPPPTDEEIDTSCTVPKCHQPPKN
jgi:hypothetical protein